MPPPPHIAVGPRVAWKAILVLFCGFAVLALCVLRFGSAEGSYTFDQNTYHLPNVHHLVDKWPRLNIASDAETASPPAYHYFLATCARLLGLSDDGIRGVNLLVSFLSLVVLANALHERAWPTLPILGFLFPLLCSGYFLKSAGWLVTDNASLTCTAAALAGVFALSSLHPHGRWLRAGFFAGLAVAVRQTSVWLVGPLAVRVVSSRWSALPEKTHPRVAFDWRKVVAMALPVGVLIFLYVVWGGLAPPQWRERHQDFSVLPLFVMVGLYGALGAFFLPLLPAARLAATLYDRRFHAALIAAVLIAAIAPSGYDFDAGRWGGPLWATVRKVPLIFGRSPVIVLLAALGVYVVCSVCLELAAEGKREDALCFATALLCVGGVQCFNHFLFQRYFEPTALVLIVFSFGLLSSTRIRPGPAWTGAAVLVVLQAAAALLSIFSS